MLLADNPLLNIEQFPDYDAIRPEHALPAIKYLCATCKKAIDDLLTQGTDWGTYESIEVIDNKLSKAWSPISHLHSVMNNDEWRQAYQKCQPIIAQYGAEMAQHSGLYAFYCALKASAAFAEFDSAQQKLINDAIRDFKLSGVDLPDSKKAEYQQLIKASSELSTTFTNHLLDATQAFHIHITDESYLAGIPRSAKALYRQLAKQNDVDGYWISLDFPAYYPALTYADSRELRRKLHYAYATRASDIGPHANEFDNTDIIDAMMGLRRDLAALLGFSHYADLSLANKMARSTSQVMKFLRDLGKKSKPQAQKEYADLQAYAAKHLGLATLQPWDIAYVSEKLKQHHFALSQEQLREYFPVPKVIDGLFAITSKLFDVTFDKNHTLSTWHDDVETFSVKNSLGQVIAYFYMDLYARQGKNGGAWMNGAVDHIDSRVLQQKAVVYLTCNFIPPTGDEVAYLSHDEVSTLFHEFGHGLHHMLTTVKYAPISGINGVEWDAVELPSQFMENFCFERQVLVGLSQHRETGKPLPDDLFDKIRASKNYHSALAMLRQIEFSLFDMSIHTSRETPDIMQNLAAIHQEIAVIPMAEYSRFPMSFSHIFSGSYAAGYFSYKWAEVLSADAFSRFEEEGVYNKAVGGLFKQEILERGASRSAMDNFIAFRGREPDIGALLLHSGIKA